MEDGKSGYVGETGNVFQLAEAVIRFFSEQKADEFEQNVMNEEYKYSWERMVEIVEQIFS